MNCDDMHRLTVFETFIARHCEENGRDKLLSEILKGMDCPSQMKRKIKECSSARKMLPLMVSTIQRSS